MTARPRRGPSLAAGIGTIVAITGLARGLQPLHDNSFLTHLATGRFIFGGGGFPHADPYTFTAAGDPWVVQSWFASVLYGLADEIADERGVQLLMGATTAALALVGWWLTAVAGTLIGRVLTVAPFLLVGVGGWTSRPYLLGLLCMGLALLAAEGRLDPRWLVPVGWMWLNVHGSWPLGLVAIAAMALGRRLDGERPTAELTVLRWLGIGLALGAINPYGPRLLVFPFELLSKRDVLEVIVEWQPPKFDRPGQLAFFLVLAAAVVALRRAPSWRATLPLVLFVTAACIGARNIEVAALVLLPAIARGMPSVGVSTGEERTPAVALGFVTVIAAGALIVGVAASSSPIDLDAYPLAATGYLEDHALAPTEARVVTHDFVGNFWAARYGPDAQVFVDDRVEVLPSRVVLDYVDLLEGVPEWSEILTRYQPDAIVWQVDRPLASLLAESDDWRIVHRDDDFLVAVPA